MPSNLTPVDTWPSAFEVQINGDPVSGTTTLDVMQEYADAATFLRNRVWAAKQATRTLPLNFAFSKEFELDISNNYSWKNPNLTQGQIIGYLPEWPSAQITNLIAHIQPSAGSYAAAGTLAQLRLLSLDLTTHGVTILDTVTDPSASAGAYDTLHSFELIGAGRDLLPTDELLMWELIQDDGGVANWYFLGLEATIGPT